MFKNARQIIVEEGRCPINKMVEVQNESGLSPTVIISTECYKKLFETCDEFKSGYCQIKLIWKESEERPETIIELEGPCFNNVSYSREPEYKSYFRVKEVKAIGIQYTKSEGSSTQYFSFKYE